MNNDHYYFQFDQQLRTGVVPKVTVDLLNFYANKKISKKLWIKEKEFSVHYMPDKERELRVSKPMSYSIVSKYIYGKHGFSPDDFDLYRYECFWLDFSIDMQIDFHKADPSSSEALTFVLPQTQMYGESYPITLRLDREGHVYSSMQKALTQRIISLRNKLVMQSNEALKSDWLFDLRSLISDSISLVDITLHQFYNKAQFDPMPGWQFDKAEVGDKFGRRFKDKLRWIGQITGTFLDNASHELASFHELREIRNHMMHFDPPSLTIPLEEASLWLNKIVDIAFLVSKIRDKIGAGGSTHITNFMLQKDVFFVPRSVSIQRLPLDSSKNGYLSSCWPNENCPESSLGKDNSTSSIELIGTGASAQLVKEGDVAEGTDIPIAKAEKPFKASKSVPKGFSKSDARNSMKRTEK